MKKRKAPKGKPGSHRSTDDLEARLDAALVPVTPRVEFVEQLGIRLQNEIYAENQDEGFFHYWTWVAAGLISSILAVIGVRRYMQREEPGMEENGPASFQSAL